MPAGIYARQLADEVAVGGAFRRSVWTRQLEAIQRIAGQLTRLATIEEVGAAICRETRQVLEYDEAHVLLRAEDGSLSSAAAVAGPVGEHSPPPLPVEGIAAEVIARAVETGTPLLVAECLDPSPERRGAWSLLVVPMRYDRMTTGAISLLKARSGGFDDDDVRLLQILADQAAVAIENAKLLAGRDELVVADCDLDACLNGKAEEFNFARNRRPEHYAELTAFKKP